MGTESRIQRSVTLFLSCSIELFSFAQSYKQTSTQLVIGEEGEVCINQ